MKTQKKKKKIIKPFALKCPVCNGRGEVRACLYEDDPLSINMTYVRCRSCKGNGYIIFNGVEFTESQPNIATKEKKNKDSAWSMTSTQVNNCNNCIYACPTLNSHPSSRYCLLKHKDFPAIYICSDWSCKT